jgi:hypothetical protein
MSPFGPSRHFIAMRQFGRYRMHSGHSAVLESEAPLSRMTQSGRTLGRILARNCAVN